MIWFCDTCGEIVSPPKKLPDILWNIAIISISEHVKNTNIFVFLQVC